MSRFIFGLQRFLLLFFGCFPLSLPAEKLEAFVFQLKTGFYYPYQNDTIHRKVIKISLKLWLQELTKAKNPDVSWVRQYDTIMAMHDDFIKKEIDYLAALYQ